MLELSEQERETWCSDLNDEQTEVFSHYLNGDNVFMTGAGGCGKTYLIRRIYEHGVKTRKNIQVCATTGCAAILLKCHATTIHSWAGIGIGNNYPEYYAEKIKRNRNKLRNWKTTDTLVIDEISMLSKHLLDLLDQIGRILHNRDIPFGGIQVIASGDFYQLPPVSKMKDSDESAFAFESENWTKIFPVEIELVNNHRQSDPVFRTILNQIRVGRITRSTVNRLNDYVGREPTTSNYKPSRLLPTRAKVSAINKKEMSLLPEPSYTYEAIRKDVPIAVADHTSGRKMKPPSKTAIDTELDYIMKNSMFEHTLELKKHAQVMCITNLDINKEIVNGSIGRVIDVMTKIEYAMKYGNDDEKEEASIADSTLDDNKEYPVVEFMNGVILRLTPHVWLSDKYDKFGIGVAQVPLILAWAVSIHKSQGMTVDMAEVDIGHSIFECGQTYVALSRVKSLDGLYLTCFNPAKILVNRKVKQFYQAMLERQYEDSEESEDEASGEEVKIADHIDMDKFRALHGYDETEDEMEDGNF